MPITLYDLAGADPARRFSPNCWRTRMALAHKGLAVDAVPWRFTDKQAIAFSGQGAVPVIVDGGRSVADSWEIARYLEEAYPERPSLFGGEAAVTPIRFIQAWTERVLQPGVGRLIMADIFAILHEKDRAYFRESREKRFGMALEAVSGDREERLPQFRQSLEPLRVVFAGAPFLGGEGPCYGDYVVFGAFQWARCVSPFRLLADDDPILTWQRRLRALFDGLADSVPAFD